VVLLFPFIDQNALFGFADGFVKERINSLEKDVRHCLNTPYAPFPALLYCFATIDLLGSLYYGDATKKADTTKQSKSYMKDFMNYSDDEVKLLQDIFRHKLVHLAQPKPSIKYDGHIITWEYSHNDTQMHRKRIPSSSPVIPEKFCISIMTFMEEIRDSVVRPGGYLDRLKGDNLLQNKFQTAILQIHNPENI